MRSLTASPGPILEDPGDIVAEVLDRRLSLSARDPLAIALSGGGDSTALAVMAAEWAARRGRSLVVFTVDHGLNPASAAWTAHCALLARELGADFHPLHWLGEKPVTGLQAAARKARHRLIARAARERGAKVILFGHTEDDRAESALMRAMGATVPDPREWSPSPAWPEGRGLFVLRPMLRLRRASLRDWLTVRGLGWIDDPANANPGFARSRARQLAPPPPGPVTEPSPGLATLAMQVSGDLVLALPREALRRSSPQDAETLTAMACLCAAGTTRPPRGDRLERLSRALRGDAEVTASLAGARIEADAGAVRWMRQAGDIARSDAPPLVLQPGETGVWDGRFEVSAQSAVTVSALSGSLGKLSRRALAGARRIAPAARGAMPAVAGACPAFEPIDGVEVRALSLERLRAACGVYASEDALLGPNA